MPIYEFRCDAGHETEGFFQRPADEAAPWPPPSAPCGTCGREARRFPSVTASPEIRFPRRWHYGIGAYVESTAEVNRIAKEKELVHIGRDHGG